ncbi:MAG: PAS domain S-box protein [Rhodoferax sp.]|nr:PAS domain S-box protein [Rhodoferax sp.]
MPHGSPQSYVLTLALMGLALWVRLAIAPVNAGLQYVTFFPAVTIAAITGGHRAGLLATAVGLVFATYIFTPPYYSLSIEVLVASAWSNLVFLMDGIIISYAIEAMHRYRQRYALELQQSRDAHAALEESTQYLKTIIDNLFTYVALLDVHGVVQEVNKAPLERGGYCRKDVIGKFFYDTPWWTHDQTVRAQLMAAMEAARQGQTRRRDLVVRMGDDLVPIDFQISPVRDGDGRVVGLLPTGVDISERKQMEATLLQSEATLEQFKFTLDHTQDGVLIFLPTTLRFIYTNHGAKRQVGYSAEELLQMTPLDIKPGFSEQRFRAMLEPLLDGSLQVRSFETVHRHKDGHDIPVEIVLQLVQRVDLESRFVAFSRDISERKRVETELRIAAAAFESQESIMVTDANCVILRINTAFTRTTGYTAKEVIGQSPRIVQSGRHDTAFYALMWESINRTGSWEGEIWNRHKDGTIHPKWLSITAVKSDDGTVTHYVGAETDITQRKEIEDAVRYLASYDPLTKLPNRRLLCDRLGLAMAASKRNGLHGALIFLDLDNFKPLNDTHGHEVGDSLLLEAANRLKSCIRETDTAARFGGDEFVVVLGELNTARDKSIEQAMSVAEKIRSKLSEPYFLTIKRVGLDEAKTVEHHCSASIGVTVFTNHAISQEDIMKQADLAMYQAKEAGRNLIRFL